MSLAADEPEDWTSDRDEVSGRRAEIAEEAFVPAPEGAPDPLDDDAPLWECTDDAAAGWCLRKIARAKAEMLRHEENAEYEIAGIRQWLDEVSSPLARTIGFFEGRLVAYRRRLEDENPDLPLTYKLPGGDLVRRAGRARTVVVDEEAFTSWALEQAPDAVAVKPLTSKLLGKESPFDVTDTGAVVDRRTGEVVPGVQVTQGSPSYGVKVR